MNEIAPVFLIHFAATCYMTGIIWFVQLIQYRYLDDVPADSFAAHHQRYMKTMGYVVGPAMLIELLTGILLAVQFFGSGNNAISMNTILLIVIWCSTIFYQVPCHTKLQRGYDPSIHKRLLQTNWIRTAAWSARVLFLFIFMLSEIGVA